MKPTSTPAPPRKASPAELGASVFFFVATVVLAGLLLQHRLEQRPRGEGDPLANVIVPTVAQEGVTVTPGRGRLLSVDSTPGGAVVTLDGALRGETPFSTDFACSEGTVSVLELTHPGYQRARFELNCVGGSTRVSATLKKSR